MSEWVVVSLGGSIMVPEGIDVEFIKRFRELVRRLLTDDYRLVLITGGGKICRRYQEAARALGNQESVDQDMIGIRVTRVNAELLRSAMPEAEKLIITDPTSVLPRDARLIIGAGWKPGCSTDYDAALVCSNLQAKRLVNISNVAHVYDKDPRTHPEATCFKQMTWDQLLAIVGSTWSPGLNAPFDPIAAKLCQEQGLEVVILSGQDLANVENAIRGKDFVGTRISDTQ
jgi:uridylate kinase